MGEKKKDWKFYVLMILSYSTMIMFGVIENAKGVTFTAINEEFQVRYDEQGYLVSFSWYGYVIFCLVCAYVLTHWGLKASIISGYILNCLGCITTAYAPNFVVVVITLMVVWMGFGFYEVGYNALASVLFTENSAIYLNLMHFFYGFGAIIGPQVASWLVRLIDGSYRGVYKGLFTVIFVLFILTIFTPFTSVEKKSDSSDSNGKVSISSMFKMPYIWWASITLGFMEVIEFAASNWGTLYYRDVYQLDPNKEGAFFVSMYYFLFTLSRLVSGFFIEKMGYYRYLFSSLIIVAVIFLVGFLVGVNGRWVIPFTGFFIGPMFPTYMCVLMKVFGDEAGTMSSIVIFLSGATNGLIQLIIGYINEWIGYEWGFRASIIYSLIPFVLLIATKKLGDKVSLEFNKPKVEEVEMTTVVEVPAEQSSAQNQSQEMNQLESNVSVNEAQQETNSSVSETQQETNSSASKGQSQEKSETNNQSETSVKVEANV